MSRGCIPGQLNWDLIKIKCQYFLLPRNTNQCTIMRRFVGLYSWWPAVVGRALLLKGLLSGGLLSWARGNCYGASRLLLKLSRRTIFYENVYPRHLQCLEQQKHLFKVSCLARSHHSSRISVCLQQHLFRIKLPISVLGTRATIPWSKSWTWRTRRHRWSTPSTRLVSSTACTTLTSPTTDA